MKTKAIINEDVGKVLIRLQTLQLLTPAVTRGHIYSPPSGLTVTGVRLVSVLQCRCIQLLPGAARSSTLRIQALSESTDGPGHTPRAGMNFRVIV